MSDKKQTRGTVKAVPCPHCKKPNDLRGLEDYGCAEGNVFICDHCQKQVQIAKLQKVTLVWCRKFVSDPTVNILHGG